MFMELLFLLLGLLLLAIPIVAVVALVKAVAMGEQLRRIEASAARACEPRPAMPQRAAVASSDIGSDECRRGRRRRCCGG